MAVSIKVMGGSTGDFELKGSIHRIGRVLSKHVVDLFDVNGNALYTIPAEQIRYVNHMDKTDEKDLPVRNLEGKIGIRVDNGVKSDIILKGGKIVIDWIFNVEHIMVYDKEGKILLFTIPLKLVRYIDYDCENAKNTDKVSK